MLLDNLYTDTFVQISLGDSIDYYKKWIFPDVIISDGAYGILGFNGDTSDYFGLPDWYEQHIKAWTKYSKPKTTLWFWNSEIGWATVHPILEKYGWRYVNCNIWDKGKAHIAGNVNTKTIRRFPVVTEVCVQYVREALINNLPLKVWLLWEWKRTGLPLKHANNACGVKNAATRKYFNQGHLWYFPPTKIFERLVDYANKNGKSTGRPYYSVDGIKPLSGNEWAQYRAKFQCPYGYTNVWDHPPVGGKERITTDKGKAIHPNQKPLNLMKLIIEASSDNGDVIWEPFGGLFSASLMAKQLERKAFSCEINPIYFQFGTARFKDNL